MKLFKSKFASLEAFADAKPEERTPEMLAAAQAEMTYAGIILVPMSDTVKSGEDLQKHMDSLVHDATVAKAAAKTAQDALAALKGERVLPSNKVTSEKKEGGDGLQDTPEQKEAKAAIEEVHNRSYTQQALRMMEMN